MTVASAGRANDVIEFMDFHALDQGEVALAELVDVFERRAVFELRRTRSHRLRFKARIPGNAQLLFLNGLPKTLL